MANFVQNPRKRDWWIVPTYFTTDTHQIVVNDGGADVIVDLPVSASFSSFWPHTTPASGYPGIYANLTADALANTIALGFRACTPTDSPLQFGGGLEVFSDAALTLVFSSGDWTMDPRLFGYPAGWVTDVVLTASGAEYVAQSPMTRRTTWRSYTLGASGIASKKRIIPEETVAWSHNRPQDRYAVVWEEQEPRGVVYEFVGAAHVFEQDAANLFDYATNQGIGQDDDHNAFETIWRALNRNEIALVVHDQDTWDLALDPTYTEAVALVEPSTKMDRIVTPRRMAGDLWDLRLDVYSLGSAS